MSLTPALSVLDLETRELCPACIEQKAEALPALVRTVSEVGWRNLPEAIRDLIRVWDIDAFEGGRLQSNVVAAFARIAQIKAGIELG